MPGAAFESETLPPLESEIAIGCFWILGVAERLGKGASFLRFRGGVKTAACRCRSIALCPSTGAANMGRRLQVRGCKPDGALPLYLPK